MSPYATALALACAVLAASPALAQVRDSTSRTADSITVRLVDVELRVALQSLARYLERPLVYGNLPATKVSVETPSPVPRTDILALVKGILDGAGLELSADSGLYRVRTRADGTPGNAASGPTGGASAQPIELYVLRLRHAKASEVAATVNALYGRAAAFGELRSPRARTLGQDLREPQAPQAAPQTSPNTTVAVAGRDAVLAGDVTIIPDPRANSLLIRASRSDFDLVAAAVRELDVRPLQVLIELMIAEVRHDRALGFGVDAALPQQNLPGSGTSVSATTAGAGLGDFVLKLMSIGGLDVDATLRAAASRGDVSILSRPVVITANNHAAEILVGSQRPFVQVSRTLPTDSPLRDQVVQYKEVGTKLSVLPTISDDGYIMLEVTQEVNAATAETQFDAPVISTRLVQTRLLVKDGQTVALGGLTDRQRDANTSGVPILSAIPLIGGLFGRTSRRTSETELFLFLSPRVLRTDEDADHVTEPLKQRAEKLKP